MLPTNTTTTPKNNSFGLNSNASDKRHRNNSKPSSDKSDETLFSAAQNNTHPDTPRLSTTKIMAMVAACVFSATVTGAVTGAAVPGQTRTISQQMHISDPKATASFLALTAAILTGVLVAIGFKAVTGSVFRDQSTHNASLTGQPTYSEAGALEHRLIDGDHNPALQNGAEPLPDTGYGATDNREGSGNEAA